MANPIESFKALPTGGKVAVVGGSTIAVYLAWRYKKNHSAGAAATDPNAIDPVTGLPYSQDNVTDPATGQTYLQEAQAYGSVAAAEQALGASGAGGIGAGIGYTGGGSYSPGGTTGGGVSTDVTSTGYSSNAQWAAAVQAGLTSIGYSATDVAAALGLYLAGLPLTAAQAGIIQTALAEYGPPPSGSFTVNLAPSTGPTGSGPGTPPPGGPKGPITVIPQGLHTTQVSATSVGVAWEAPTIPAGQGPLTGYTLQVFTASGQPEGTPWTVPPSQLYGNAGGLKPKTAYHINVWCDPAKTGGPHATVSFTTK